MIKLYRRDGDRLLYHEAWINGRRITEHWGVCPDRGQTKEHSFSRGSAEDEAIEAVLAAARKAGYAEIDLDDHARLMIEYRVEGMGSVSDLEKRHALEERMNETLGWAGIGMCDGGSIGSGTMEVCCYVADYEIAKKAVIQDLAGTKFGDYQRIYREE